MCGSVCMLVYNGCRYVYVVSVCIVWGYISMGCLSEGFCDVVVCSSVCGV